MDKKFKPRKMSKDTGGPAFPVVIPDAEYCKEGITAHDYFAAKALQGLCANPNIISCEYFAELATGAKCGDSIALAALQLADAMLAERSK